jgi:hypothetical protein
MLMKQNISLDNIKYSYPIKCIQKQKTDKKKSLGSSYVFSKHLIAPIKWTVGCPHLQLFMEKKKSNNFKHWEKETC